MDKTEPTNTYTSEFSKLEKNFFSEQPEFIRDLRRRSISRFSELGFPTTRMEDWRNTSVATIAKTQYRCSVEQPEDVSPEIIAPYMMEGANRVVILNGRYSAEFSSLESLPETVDIKSLWEAFQGSPEKVEPFLGQFADYHNQAFVALNTAFMEDGVFLHIPENLVLESPIHLLYLFKSLQKNTVFHPRNLIHAGSNSEATVIEHYVGLDGGPYFTNHVTELVADENASIQHIKCQDESEKSNHISTIQSVQQAHSSVSTISLSVGGRLTRNDVNVILDGEGCECYMGGLVLARERQHVDNHTFIHHLKPHCTSHEVYRAIHGGRSHGVFNGRILVHQDAQKTNADQANQNLLLSRHALVNSNPQLEINADDVRCTHGSTTGQVDEEAIFYLRTRGLDPRTAHFVMIRGFANEIVEQIRAESFRNYTSELLSHWLSGALSEEMD